MTLPANTKPPVIEIPDDFQIPDFYQKEIEKAIRKISMHQDVDNLMLHDHIKSCHIEAKESELLQRMIDQIQNENIQTPVCYSSFFQDRHVYNALLCLLEDEKVIRQLAWASLHEPRMTTIKVTTPVRIPSNRSLWDTSPAPRHRGILLDANSSLKKVICTNYTAIFKVLGFSEKENRNPDKPYLGVQLTTLFPGIEFDNLQILREGSLYYKEIANYNVFKKAPQGIQAFLYAACKNRRGLLQMRLIRNKLTREHTIMAVKPHNNDLFICLITGKQTSCMLCRKPLPQAENEEFQPVPYITNAKKLLKEQSPEAFQLIQSIQSQMSSRQRNSKASRKLKTSSRRHKSFHPFLYQPQSAPAPKFSWPYSNFKV